MFLMHRLPFSACWEWKANPQSLQGMCMVLTVSLSNSAWILTRTKHVYTKINGCCLDTALTEKLYLTVDELKATYAKTGGPMQAVASMRSLHGGICKVFHNIQVKSFSIDDYVRHGRFLESLDNASSLSQVSQLYKISKINGVDVHCLDLVSCMLWRLKLVWRCFFT